ncbi:TetR/AcrR family transcriptional regulator [Pontibacter arcticus]|uniref:TetR/AcrR family transcriptional regulator n=1 Tax=Pontibacter arcticus TaxID=2080288 RepID=A0A364RCF3_9BACT|nr:TetR/AcrR family transcriptional regulator [Pontibacter arcticus]RAU81836.1 TetR/AcrR family transcriptional regulator [Pontibacter arcticus]
MSEKRERIIDAALRLFCQNGFQHTSTAAISKEAGVATGTLFLYFKSKDELINSLYIEAKNDFAAYLKQSLATAGNIEEQLRLCWQQATAWALAHPFHFRFFSMFSNSPFITRLSKDEAASSFHFLQDLVEKGIREKEFIPIEPTFFISLFNGQLQATLTYITQHTRLPNQQGVINQAFTLFIKSMKPISDKV